LEEKNLKFFQAKREQRITQTKQRSKDADGGHSMGEVRGHRECGYTPMRVAHVYREATGTSSGFIFRRGRCSRSSIFSRECSDGHKPGSRINIRSGHFSRGGRTSPWINGWPHILWRARGERRCPSRVSFGSRRTQNGVPGPFTPEHGVDTCNMSSQNSVKHMHQEHAQIGLHTQYSN
jgi:hypothetical protein